MNKREDVPTEFIIELAQSVIRMERARISTELAAYALRIVEDPDHEADKHGVSKESQVTAKVAVHTFATNFLKLLAEAPMPSVCVHCLDGTHNETIH